MADGYLRFPHLQGDLVTFVAEDDVWLAPLSGGRAWRLSADRSRALYPYFSPDGATVAWTSTRDGVPEVYAVPVDGGDSRRLTHWGSDRTLVRGWTPDGDVVAVTTAGQGGRARSWAHAVPLDGGPARRLPYGIVNEVAFGPDGEVLVATPAGYGRDLAWWKRYRGGTAARLWLDRRGDGEFERLLPDHAASLSWPTWVDGRIHVVSDHEGVAQVCALDQEAETLSPVTSHDFYVRHATTDGSRIVYVVAGELWLLDGGSAEPRRIEITLSSSRPGRAPHRIEVGKHLGAVAPDATGRASAIEVRGTVHWLTHRDGPARTLAAESGVRARLPVQVGADRVAWVSDADGEDAIEIASADAASTSRQRWASGQLGRVLDLAAAPDGSVLAAASHDGRLLLVDTASGDVREVVRSENGDVSGLAFSPDSAWLAWSHPGLSRIGGDLPGLRQIRLARVDDLRMVDVTPMRFTDVEPVFTRDGKHLAFLSMRSFDPMLDAYVFDLSFPSGCRPYLVPLAASTASPFDAELAGRAPEESPFGGKDSGADAQAPATVVDEEGLDQRIRPFPVPAARYSELRAVRDGMVWLRRPLTGELGDDRATLDDDPPRPVLERFDLERRRCEVLADGVDDVWVSGDGKRLVVLDEGSLRVRLAEPQPLGTGQHDVGGRDHDQDQVTVDLSRVRVRVRPEAEWRQAFDEAGRLMRDHFWRADMGGVDWPGVLARYRPVVDRLGSHDDLVDLLWEVQGELGTSHAYVVPPPRDDESDGRPGLLGADLRRDADGTWRIDRVLPGESSDPRARSPLLAPGAGVRAGDAVRAVDGREVDPTEGPGPLLIGTAGKPVELTVETPAGETRRVVVTPVADETPLRYHDWVAGRRAYVRERSDGRLGYLHVPDMMELGWAQLHRDLRVELSRDGVVLDVRENGGGYTSQLVVERIARRVIGWDRARDMQPEPYPLDAPRGPVVAVADEWAGSDGDIVSAAIKAYGIGPVVGVRTWGGVVGIDGRYSLVDGTVVTQPRYSFWLQGPGWGVENYGVDPDVEVVMTPQDRVAGRDPQLDRAIELALESLAERPPATPPELP